MNKKHHELGRAFVYAGLTAAWARIWEGKARWYPDGDTVFHGSHPWDELEGWFY